MDSRIDLKSLIDKQEYIIKLASALDSKNEAVKKQVIELLSALCSYSELGYKRTLEILEKHKENKNEKYRFKVLVNDLDKGSSLEYKTAILTLINSILSSSINAEKRIQMKGELIGLNISPILNNLRNTGKAVPDLQVQINRFDEPKDYDDMLIQGPDEINLNSHLAVFNALLNRITNTPQEIRFLNILQHLLRIETRETLCDVMWSTAETLVHRSSLIESQDDANRILRTPGFQKNTCPHCRFDILSQRKLSLSQTECAVSSSCQQQSSDVPPPAPPIPPPPPMMPLPQISISLQSSPLTSHNNSHSSQTIPPPPPIISQESERASSINRNMISCDKRSKTPEITAQISKTLPQQETPIPRTKMKTINWNKIPPNKVIGSNNVWSRVAEFSPITEMNWEEVEGLFCQQLTQGSPKFDTPDSRRSRRDEITLLDGKKSLNVNIFLKQFRNTNAEITRMIHEGYHETIGLEKLRGLLKILPEFDELEMLKNFDGDKSKLGNAEKFLLQLMQVPNYKLRIECMLLKEEFSANLSYLEPSINAMLYAGEDLMGNKRLQEVLYMIVLMGNFLNAGGYAGNAAGVKLASLQKLTDIRANKPGMNLIHFVALQAEKKDKKLLQFADQMNHLENASKMTIEQLNNEIGALDKRISNITKQISLPSTEDDIRIQMNEFLLMAGNEIKLLHDAMSELEKMRIRLSEFFCEDSAQFKIEECFKIFYHFCEKFKSAIKDNEKRRILDEQANLRRKQREEQLAQRRQQLSQYSNASYDSEQQNSFLMDPPTISYDIRFSPAMNRRRMGTFNNNNSNNTNNIQSLDYNREDGNLGMSPDITPNGSLRRRRSRVLSEEDEDNLMDFLRSSGHDNTLRERKSANGYGSLDRSWARRARTGNSKTRPDLLNVDFGPDRERPMSPSPTTERKLLSEQEENKPRAISKEWRQKIENWLHANEQDGKTSDEYRRNIRRVANTKRSFENEKEGENSSKLDTLLEEKHSANVSQNLSPTGISNNSEPYRRVYPEWKPLSTIEKSDNLETTETLPGMIYAQTKAVDKSSMRKSILNSTESSSDGICKRSSIKKSSSETSPQDDLNKQCIYITSNEENVTSPTNSKSTSSVYICPESQIKTIEETILSDSAKHTRRLSVNLTNNKVEIDSDNIETPPTARRSFNGSIRKTNTSEHVPLGDGQFDRFSSARRTRRFKRPTDICGSNSEEQNSQIQTEENVEQENNGAKESKSINNDVVKRIGKIGKSISKISQEDVREAIRSLKSPTPEHEWKLKESINVAPSVKITTHELNDEGFEETQSLVSDTPSLTTSSCNEELKSKKSDSTVKIPSTSAAPNALKRKPIRPSNQLQSLLSRNQQSLERSRSLRNAPTLASSRTLIQAAVQRTNSLRRSEDVQQKLAIKSVANKRLDVERSNSRTSLRSSRSSLNSAVSTNTVKKMPQKVTTSETMQQLAKRPLISTTKDTVPKPTTRVPASRSSSSGSSIQSLRKPPVSVTKLPSPSVLTSVRSKVSPPSTIPKSSETSSPSTRSNNNSNFMKPTTATKARQKIIKPK